MKVFIRTDATAAVGTGHLMRCLALGGALTRRNLPVAFLCRDLSGPLADLVARHGFGLHALDSSSGWEADAAATIAVLDRHEGEKFVVVDHYGLGKSWESSLRGRVCGILAIDDLNRHHDCDVVLDQNILDSKDQYSDRVPVLCKRFLGPHYALLRPQFAVARSRLRRRDGSLKRVLVNFGGSDPTGATEWAIQGIMAAGLDDIEVDVVLGAANARSAELMARYGGQPRFKFFTHTDLMAEMMAAADLAIGAGGSSAWERCCVGLPAIAIAVADNQRALCDMLARRNVIDLVEDADARASGKIACALASLSCDPERLIAMSKCGMDLVDGVGADRIAEEIER